MIKQAVVGLGTSPEPYLRHANIFYHPFAKPQIVFVPHSRRKLVLLFYYKRLIKSVYYYS